MAVLSFCGLCTRNPLKPSSCQHKFHQGMSNTLSFLRPLWNSAKEKAWSNTQTAPGASGPGHGALACGDGNSKACLTGRCLIVPDTLDLKPTITATSHCPARLDDVEREEGREKGGDLAVRGGPGKEATENALLWYRVQYGGPMHLFYKRTLNGSVTFLNYCPSHEVVSH